MSSTSGFHSHYTISFAALLYRFCDSHSLPRLACFFSVLFDLDLMSVALSRLLRCLIFNMILLERPILRQAALSLVSILSHYCFSGLVLVRSTTRYPIEGRHQAYGVIWTTFVTRSKSLIL